MHFLIEDGELLKNILKPRMKLATVLKKYLITNDTSVKNI